MILKNDNYEEYRTKITEDKREGEKGPRFSFTDANKNKGVLRNEDNYLENQKKSMNFDFSKKKMTIMF